MTDPMEIKPQRRPCLVGPEEKRAFFYGFTVYGTALVEFRDGTIHQWNTEEIILLDSDYEFNEYPWEHLINKSKKGLQ